MNHYKITEDIVCGHFDIDSTLLYTECNDSDLMVAKHITWYILYNVLGISYPTLAKQYNRSYSTPLYACRGVARKIYLNKYYEKNVLFLKDEVKKALGITKEALAEAKFYHRKEAEILFFKCHYCSGVIPVVTYNKELYCNHCGQKTKLEEI